MANKPSSVKRKDTRYVQGGTTTVKSNAVAWWERNVIPTASDDITIKALPMLYAGRPDLLSFDLWGDNNLEWIILQFNNIVDINEEFVAGAVIKLPSRTRVFGAILTKTIDYSEN